MSPIMRSAVAWWPVVMAASAACLPQGAGGPPVGDEAQYEAARRRMVAQQIEGRGITNPAVLAAMTAVPRHRFVPDGLRALAYHDGPLPIGDGQTISQPYIVGTMTELLGPNPGMRVLEVGTGSGYQAAVLSRCVKQVDSIEYLASLAKRAERVLAELGYRNIKVRVGDGYDGWPERAPYDAVILTAAPPEIPRPLLDQLKVGGRLVAPVGDHERGQELVVLTKTDKGFTRRTVFAVAFVPMVGKAGGGKPERP